jgi:hypothetical protein
MPGQPYLGTHRIPWPTDKGPWVLVFHLALAEDQVPRCVGVDLRSFSIAKDGKSVTPVGESLQQLTAQVWRDVAIQSEMIAAMDAHLRKQMAPFVSKKTRDRSARRAGPKVFWDEAALRSVALVYRANLGTGSPTKAVAETFDVSPSMAAKLVSRARKAGLLGKTSKGRAGGASPSPKTSRRKGSR